MGFVGFLREATQNHSETSLVMAHQADGPLSLCLHLEIYPLRMLWATVMDDNVGS